MKTDSIQILVINTGSTSTKLALFRDEELITSESADHTLHGLDKYDTVAEQIPMRTEAVLQFLAKNNTRPDQVDVIAARGGAFGIFQGGGYEIDDAILALASVPREGFPMTASSLSVLIAGELKKQYGIPAYFYDAVRTDELCDLARYSGVSFIPRIAGAHPLNTKEVGRRAAAHLGSHYEDLNLLILHLGGGISVEMHEKGRMIDKICSEEGSITPERAGKIPNDSLVELCFSGCYTQKELMKLLRGRGGLIDYLGTSDMQKITTAAEEGDEKARTMIEVMAYMTAKDAGALATTVKGRIDQVIFTGGLAYSDLFTSLLRERLSFLAPVMIIPGSFELEALAHGVLRIMNRQEEAHRYEEG